MRHRFFAIVIIVSLIMLTSGTALAQTGTSSVYLGGGPIAGSTAGTPGAIVYVPVLVTGVTGIVPSTGVEITVPSPLRTLATSTCVAETVIASAGSLPGFRSCQIVGWEGPNGAQIISAEIEGLSSMTGFRIEATLQIEIPASTPIGSSYTLSAISQGYNAFPTLSEFTIHVVANSSNTGPAASTAAPTVVAHEPLHDIDGSSLTFVMGSFQPLSFSINYDAYPNATSASLTLYADAGTIEVDDSSVIDMEAKEVCDAGATPDDYGLGSSRQPIRTLPDFFNVILPRWLEPGTEINVCAEVVYFNGSKVIGVEIYKSVISVRE